MEVVSVEPLLEIEGLDLDPTFETGVIKIARARLTNPTAKQFTYLVELYLGVDKKATSGVGQVTILAGGYVDVNFTVVMPSVERSYPVFLDVWFDTTLLKHYQATENVVITITPAITIDFIGWA